MLIFDRLKTLAGRVIRYRRMNYALDRILKPRPTLLIHGARGVITTYNNNLEFQAPFLRFYRIVWKPDWIISLIGQQDEPMEGHPLGLYKGRLVKQSEDHWEVRYVSPRVQSADNWHLMRDRLVKRVQRFSQAERVLPVDCDEFVFGDASQLWYEDIISSHFLEHVPVVPFDLDALTTWSVQPWYYRRQAQEERGADTFKDPIDHRWCKELHIARGVITGHANKDCGFHFPEDAKGRCITFHAGIASREHFLRSKHWDNTTSSGDPAKRERDDYESKFDKYYAVCNFPTIQVRLADLMYGKREI